MDVLPVPSNNFSTLRVFDWRVMIQDPGVLGCLGLVIIINISCDKWDWLSFFTAKEKDVIEEMFVELKEERVRNANLLDALNREQLRAQELQSKLDEAEPSQARVKQLENTIQGKY